MSLFAILTAAGFALPFPFLPRQLTLISAVTIGIPAFFLALGPNTRRYIPGFLKRVLGFAVPAGIIAGSVVTLSYLWAHHRYGVSGRAGCVLSTTTSGPIDTACWQPGTSTTVALLVTFFWILTVLARPFRLWKAVVITSMVLITVPAFGLPFAARFFNFDLPSSLLLESGAVGAAGAGAVELLYRLTHHRAANTSR